MLHRPLFIPLAGFLLGALLAGGLGPFAAGLAAIFVAVGALALLAAPGARSGWIATGLLMAGLGLLRAESTSAPSRYDLSRLAPPAIPPSSGSVRPLRITVIGRLLEDPRPYPNRLAFPLEIEGATLGNRSLRVNGRVLVNLYPPRAKEDGRLATASVPLTYGERVSVTGRLKLPSPTRNPGEFDYQAYLARQGVHCLLLAEEGASVRRLEPAKLSWIGACLAAKRRMNAALRASLPARDADMMAGLLFSEQGRLPPAVQDDFITTGTVHLLSTSGVHVAALAFALQLLLGPYRRRFKRPLAALLMVALVAFGVMAGGRPAVMRAVMMAALVYGADLVDREADGMNLLCAAALALLWANPASLYDLGFQFSFTAVAGLMLLTPRVEAGMEALRRVLARRELSAATKWGRGVRQAFCASVAAELALAPLLAYHTGQVSLISPLANLIVIPLSGPLIPTGLLQAAAGLASPSLAGITGYPVSGLLRLFEGAVHAFATVPGAMFHVSPPPVASLLLWYILLLAWAKPWRRSSREEDTETRPRFDRFDLKGSPSFLPRFATVLLPVGLTGALLWGMGHRGPGRLRITFIDVGQGDCALVETPDGARMLVDGGGAYARADGQPTFDVGERTVTPFLRHQGIRRLDVVLLTHPHDDHVGGLTAVVEHFAPRLVLGNGETSSSPAFQRFARAVTARRIPWRAVKEGDQFRLGGETRVEVLGPEPPPFTGTPSDANNDSVVLRVTYRGFRALLTGDIQGEAEARLMPRFGPVTLLKVAHHGSRFSTSQAFVERVRPRVAVISVGVGNTFGHPDRAVVRRLERAGAWALRTDRDGQVTVETDGARVWTRTFLHAAASEPHKTAVPRAPGEGEEGDSPAQGAGVRVKASIPTR